MLEMWRDPGTPADDYYQVRPECTDVPQSKFRIKAGKTLSARKWNAAFSTEGYLDIGKTLSRIHRGGIHPSIRGEVWEFLLGCYDPKSTYDERQQIRQRRSTFEPNQCVVSPVYSFRVKYELLKEECKKMFPLIGSGRFVTAPIISENGEPTQDPIVLQQINLDGSQTGQPNGNGPMDKKEIEWKLTLHQIGLDVVRTDRTLVFYEKQENLSKLWDILAVYSWFDLDVGYCQGMSDLCSPMIMLLEDEADAFWCFERLMRRLNSVEKDILLMVSLLCTDSSVGVESQLINLASVTQVVDPKLHQHLETLGGGDYLFAFRMLMDSDSSGEKSEESKAKAKSRRQCGKYERENMRNGGAAPLPISVFLVASVLKEKSTKLLTEAQGLDDVVKILNDITGNLDAKKACAGAMKLHKKYLKKAKYAGQSTKVQPM
ncbi:hypothetical protein DH2020_033381 [Rehmannia glutinosa]|uniref:Rab-GAP TBC domain-containing protein n=1 Tax=Rehmannia glutinosa TaxID=99300 RepID=A0ABR0VEY8_REHGL